MIRRHSDWSLGVKTTGTQGIPACYGVKALWRIIYCFWLGHQSIPQVAWDCKHEYSRWCLCFLNLTCCAHTLIRSYAVVKLLGVSAQVMRHGHDAVDINAHDQSSVISLSDGRKSRRIRMDPTEDEYRARAILVRFGYEAEHI